MTLTFVRPPPCDRRVLDNEIADAGHQVNYGLGCLGRLIQLPSVGGRERSQFQGSAGCLGRHVVGQSEPHPDFEGVRKDRVTVRDSLPASPPRSRSPWGMRILSRLPGDFAEQGLQVLPQPQDGLPVCRAVRHVADGLVGGADDLVHHR